MNEQMKQRFFHDANQYVSMNTSGKFPLRNNELWPIYEDDQDASGALDPHYFLQDIYMAKEVLKHRAELHYDIGSAVSGFIAHLLSGNQKVAMMDIRPLPWKIENLMFVQSDATMLENIEDESIESLSSLHAVEHFGLGRYGDPINPESWRYALQSMQRVLKKGGRFYFSVPVGREEKVVFNAHRIFHPSTVIETVPELILEKIAYISLPNITEVLGEDVRKVDVPGDYLAGCFVFHKPS